MQMDGNNTDSWNTGIFFPRDLVDMLKSPGLCVGLHASLRKGASTITKKFWWTGMFEAPVMLSHLLLPLPGHRATLLVQVSDCVSSQVLFMPTAKRISLKTSGAVSELHWTPTRCELWLWHSWLILYGIGASGWIFYHLFWPRPWDRDEYGFLHTVCMLALVKSLRRNTSLKQAVEVTGS